MKSIIFKSHTSILTVCFLFETALQSQLALNIFVFRSPRTMLNNLAKTPEASSLEAGSDELCLETECRPGRASPEEAGEAQGEVP